MLNTLMMAEPGKTISGDDLYNLIQAAKAEGVTATSKMHELKGVSIQTFVLPGPGAVQQATRSGRRKGAAMANSERKTARGGSSRGEGSKTAEQNVRQHCPHLRGQAGREHHLVADTWPRADARGSDGGVWQELAARS